MTARVAAPLSGRLWFAIMFASGFALVAILCAPAWDYPIFADDYQYGAIGEANPFEHFVRPHTENAFYRPIAFLTISATQRFFGTHTWPLHVLHYIVHAALGVAVFWLARRLSRSNLAAVLSWAFFITAQGAAHALASNDTLTQILSTAAGFGVLCIVVNLASEGDPVNTPSSGALRSVLRVASVAGLAALSLWSKESAVGLLAVTGAALVVAVWHRRLAIARVVPVLVSIGAVTIAYWVARSAASRATLHFGSGRHDLAIGLINAKNVVMMLVAAASPLSTVQVYVGVADRDFVTLGVFAALLGCVGVLMLAGIRSKLASPRLTALAIAGAAVVVCFPAALQNRVSELYAYNCLPFVAILVGLGASVLIRDRHSRPRLALGISLTAIILVSGAISTHSKARLMAESGRQADVVLAALCDHVSHAEQGSRIGLVDVHERPSYSVFVMSPFELIGPTAEDDIIEMTQRPDVDLQWLSPSIAARSRDSGGFTEFVEYRHGCVVPHRFDAPEPAASRP